MCFIFFKYLVLGTRKRKAEAANTDVHSSAESTITPEIKHPKPAQDNSRNHIFLLEAELEVIVRRRNSISAESKEQA